MFNSLVLPYQSFFGAQYWRFNFGRPQCLKYASMCSWQNKKMCLFCGCKYDRPCRWHHYTSKSVTQLSTAGSSIVNRKPKSLAHWCEWYVENIQIYLRTLKTFLQLNCPQTEMCKVLFSNYLKVNLLCDSR